MVIKSICPYTVIGAVLYAVILASSCLAQSYSCLPPDVKEDSIVSVVANASPQGGQTKKEITVAGTLKTLKAKCYRGDLVDRAKRVIRFYRLQGCWGNPPADYLEILEAQRKEIAKLKRKYTVIEMTCSPEETPRLISTKTPLGRLFQ